MSPVQSDSLRRSVVHLQVHPSRTIGIEISALRVYKTYFSKEEQQRYPRGQVKERAFVVEAVAPTLSACHLQLHLVRLSKVCQGRMVLLGAISLLEDQIACRTHSKMREIRATSVGVGVEVRGMTESAVPADTEAVHRRTECLLHQYDHARTKQCTVEMEQQSDLDKMTYSLKEICEEVVKLRETFAEGLVQIGETRGPMNLRETREGLAETKDSIESGEESLIREMEVIAEMGGREERAVGAEESADEAAMTAREIEALQITRGRGDDILE